SSDLPPPRCAAEPQPDRPLEALLIPFPLQHERLLLASHPRRERLLLAFHHRPVGSALGGCAQRSFVFPSSPGRPRVDGCFEPRRASPSRPIVRSLRPVRYAACY